MSITDDEIRKLRELERFSDDPSASAWPGQYRRGTTQLAWEAWRERAEIP